MGQWKGPGRQCEAGNKAEATFENYSLPQIISKRLLS